MEIIKLHGDGMEEPDSSKSGLNHELCGFFMNFKSSAMRKVIEKAARFAKTNQTVLIQGETGTGKSHLGRWLKERSSRAESHLIQKSCGEFNSGTVSSELFGHVKGAYTGATSDKDGLFVAADKGTLILDDIDYLPKECQRYLLRYLDDQMIQRMGDNARNTRKVDVRLIVTTNKNLEIYSDSDLFLHDLYHRIRVFNLVIPPLRERMEDIPHLAKMYLDRVWKEEEPEGKEPWSFSKEVLDMLHSRQWPGNMRELEGVVRNLAILTDGDHRPISVEQARDILTELPNQPKTGRTRSIDDEMMYKLLQVYSGNKSVVAELMGVSRNTIYERIRRHGWNLSR